MQWRSGQAYQGQFDDGAMHGIGNYTWPDGANYQGAFQRGRRTGLGRYTDAEQSSFAGRFTDGKREGLGVASRVGEPLLLQRWQQGALIENNAIKENSRCSFADNRGSWMVEASACINGLAHGEGVAVSLDGGRLIPAGEWILGMRTAGRVIELPKLLKFPIPPATKPSTPSIGATADG
jgi:hypothetical protein